MIGRLQGENGDLNNKFLKKNSKRVGRKYLEALRRISQACKMAAKFRKLKVSISQPMADFTAITLCFRSQRLILQPKANFAACEIGLQLGMIGFQWL